MFVYCNEYKQLSTLCTGAQASVSAAPQQLQTTQSMQCSNQGNTFFYPFLGMSIFSAILLAAIVTICSCIICVYCDQRDYSKKKEGSEIPLDRPPESQPPREEPPENLYGSGSVPTSASAIPETVITEHGLGESAPSVESTYSTVIPKVSLWYSPAFPYFFYHFQNVYGL